MVVGFGNVGAMDGAVEPTGMYLRRFQKPTTTDNLWFDLKKQMFFVDLWIEV